MEKGTLLKRYGGFYYVLSQNNEIYESTYRGRHRLTQEDIYPGDYVEFKINDEGKGIIEGVLPRKNLITKPSVANITQLVCVAAFKNPNPNLYLLDRLLAIGEMNRLKIIICFNKRDLVSHDQAERILEAYRGLGYGIIVTSAKQNIGIVELETELSNNISVLAGQSGVGKSSLLNGIQPGLNLKVADISEKLKSGRHTTRSVELIKLSKGGLVADTPGFSRLDISGISAEKIGFLFPEFLPHRENCRFSTCTHSSEPSCAVIDALNRGEINKDRYTSYLAILEEVKNEEGGY